ncbi:hypothetical protein ABK040_014072 [Willaertia magna]
MDDDYEPQDDFNLFGGGDDDNNNNGAEDGSDEQDQQFKHLKDSILFLVDARSSMFNTTSINSSDNEDDKNNHIPFLFTLKAIANVFADKIISSPSDLLSIVFYNCKEKNNPFEFENIVVFQDLDTPDAKRIKDIESLTNNYTFGSKDDSCCIHEALWTCQHLFSLVNQSTLGYKRIFLFTNDDNPCKDNNVMKLKCIERSRDLMHSDITIDLFVLKKEFKAELFWNEMLHVTDDEYTGNIKYDCSEMFNDLKERIRRREYKKRGITNLNLNLGKDMTVNVTLYSTVQKAKKPSHIFLHADTNRPLKSETKLICEDTGSELLKSDIKYYFEYGNERIEFTADELAQMKKQFSGQPGIKLMGFKPRNRLKVYHNFKTSGFIYPNDSKIQGSGLTLSALHKKMIEMNKIAICRMILREGTMPYYTALLPQEEQLDENDHSQIQPPGFQLIYIPYADGIRKLNVHPTEETLKQKLQPTDKQIQLGKRIAKKLHIDFNPYQFDNPNLQQFYQSLQALALEHSEIEKVEDLVKPDIEGMKKYESLLTEFKETIFPVDYDPEKKKKTSSSTSSRRKATSSSSSQTSGNDNSTDKISNTTKVKKEEDSEAESDSSNKKKRKRKEETGKEAKEKEEKKTKVKKEKKEVKKEVNDDDEEEEEEEIDMVQLIKDGKADKLKADILKEFCRLYKLKVSGTKKELIERITEFLKKKKKI